MCVCMYFCMSMTYVFMYVCMYVCMHVCRDGVGVEAGGKGLKGIGDEGHWVVVMEFG